MARTLQLNVLGRFEALWPDGEPADLSIRKAQALLAYLAVERAHPHTREHLATLLWSDTGDERARHNLRQVLAKIRRDCGQVIRAEADTLALDTGVCGADVIEFERLSSSDDSAALRRALDLCRGDLLAGATPRERVYEEWLLPARTRLREQASRTAVRLVGELRKRDDVEAAIEALRDLLRIDPASEPAHRELMDLLAGVGRRSDALRQYQTCVDALERELSAEPSAETRKLYDELRKTEPASAQVDARAADAGESKRLPRKLTAILYADAARYSRLTSEDEDLTHRTLSEYLDLFASASASHGGGVVHLAGDAVLARFESVSDALSCAMDVQEELHTRNDRLAPERQVRFRIGVNSGNVIEDRGDIYGGGVNVAARLEALAEPGGVCISDAARVAVGNRLPYDYEFLGEQQVKNIVEPVRAYRVSAAGTGRPSGAGEAVSPELAPPGKPSLFVVPFTNMSADPEQDYFAEGLTKDIGIALIKIPGLFLTMDESPAAPSTALSVQDIGRRYGVRYVLAGGVRRHGDRVRVNAELIESSSGRRLWAERFDRDLHDLFAIQDEITEEIVTAMDVKLMQGEDARFMRKALRSPQALDASYRGWHLLSHRSSTQDVREAQHLFEEVIRLEPENPFGYAIAALAYWAESGFGRIESRSPAMRRAAELAREALERGDTTGYCHLILTLVHLSEQDYEAAMLEANEGVAARPSCNGAYAIKSSVLNYLGRPDEAIEFARFAIRLTPAYPAEFPAILAVAYHDSGRHEEAIVAARASLKLKRGDLDPWLVIAASSVALGRSEDAAAAAGQALQINPTFDLDAYAASQPYQDRDRLEQLIERLRNAGLGQ